MGDIQFTPPSMNAEHSVVISITAKIMVAAIITIFFLVVFCLFLMLCARWQLSDIEDPSIVSWRRRTARRRQTGAVAVRKRGLDRATLKSLPVLVYDPKDFKEGLECAVCLSEVSEGEKARLLPKCNHGFHVECIDMWFKSHSTCPLCRNPVISTKKSENDSNNNDVELDGTNRTVSDSESDSDSDSDSDYNHSHEAAVHSGETAAFPTNVLFWGDESQVRAHGEATNATAASTTASSSSNTGGQSQRDELVIEIPRALCDDCEEETKTPVVSRLRSLRRMLSRGKRVAPSTSGEAEAV